MISSHRKQTESPFCKNGGNKGVNPYTLLRDQDLGLQPFFEGKGGIFLLNANDCLMKVFRNSFSYNQLYASQMGSQALNISILSELKYKNRYEIPHLNVKVTSALRYD